MDLTLGITSSQGVTTAYNGRLPGTDSQLDLDPSTLLFIGGTALDTATVSGAMYNNGLQGCIIQLRSSTEFGDWQMVALQDQAALGAGISLCVV